LLTRDEPHNALIAGFKRDLAHEILRPLLGLVGVHQDHEGLVGSVLLNTLHRPDEVEQFVVGQRAFEINRLRSVTFAHLPACGHMPLIASQLLGQAERQHNRQARLATQVAQTGPAPPADDEPPPF
jgi:hypothetical protein